LFWLQINRLQ